MRVIKKKAYGKVNLTLEVIKKTSLGFHELRTVMTKLPNLCDDISFEIKKSSKTTILITTNRKEIPTDKYNICHKAAIKFLRELKLHVSLNVNLEKRIPVGAGLGGGSSNAASTFLALNEYFDSPISVERLAELAAEVGKDIPFFLLQKNTALMSRFGDFVDEELAFPPCYILLINPRIHISTAIAYGKLKEGIWFMEDPNRKNLSTILFEKLKERGCPSLKLYNDFEITVEQEYPIIKNLKQSLLAFGAKNSLMSGSGSTVFGIFSSRKELLRAKEKMQKQFPDFFVEVG